MSHVVTPAPVPPAPDPRERLPRLVRLAQKELREILRDRRTIITLVLMPLLLYPLLTIAFQQFFMSQLGRVDIPRYTLGFENETEARFLLELLAVGGLQTVEVGREVGSMHDGSESKAIVESGVRPELEAGLAEYDIDVALRLKGDAPRVVDPRRDVAVDVELLFRDDLLHSRHAADYIEKHLNTASELLLKERLKALRLTQRAAPVEISRISPGTIEATAGSISIAAVIPFVLILMTVTGAVYPAIDLTAGERERGTLEILVAAPIPRMGVLFAKYVAVLTVALLTAAANLITMTITISASGLGRLVFGEAGISFGIMAAVFGLLLLFAAFFSAVLLVITSCARSFKEAQAYLIPLIIVSMAPGMLSLMPDIKLSGLLLVTPLANMVLLGRDLFTLQASGGAALTVVVSTLIYAAAAIGLAARVFGSEAVLYSNQSGWADLFRRSRDRQSAPSLTAGVVCLALMVPAYFLLMGFLGGSEGIDRQLLGGVLVTALVFGVIPLLACWLQRVSVAPAFVWPRNGVAVFIGAIFVGLSLWMLSHELVVFSKTLRGVQLDPAYLERVQHFAKQLREQPLALVLVAMALVPAFFEEAFFRGFLFAALRRSTTAATAIVASAVAFGLFHGIMPNPLASERLLSSTLIGLVLGWVRWRTGSVLPGLVLHVCHNGLLMLIGYYETELTERGFGVGEGANLPTTWIGAAALAVAVGLLVIWLFGRGRETESQAAAAAVSSAT